jgi:Zn-dependent peptidase ImmA (M78 family)
MNDKVLLARRAIRAALETRIASGASKAEPLCVFDVAERLGIEVYFCLGNSFGGAYARASNTVLVPSLRPVGRQAFTCAHELGHWYFGHGNRVDRLSELDVGSDDDPDERLANLFAAHLLMPAWAIDAALIVRNWRAYEVNAVQAYTLACQFGVGYETLIQHLRYSLNILPSSVAERLLKTTPKRLRKEILGDDTLRHLVLVDGCWRRVAIDLQVGDIAVIRDNVSLEGACAREIGDCPHGAVIEGSIPGVGFVRSRNTDWAASVRVRRKDFHGRSIYRHLEDPDVHETA